MLGVLKRGSRWTGILLCIIATVISIFLLEILSRNVILFDRTKIIYKDDLFRDTGFRIKLSQDPVLLYEWKEFPRSVMQDKPRGAFRIIVLGDSITYRTVGDINDYYPKKLEDLLNGGGLGLSYEVINAGVPGYNTQQEVRLLKKRLLGLNPDMVVVGYCSTNDRAIKRKFIREGDQLYSCDVIESYPYIFEFPFHEALMRRSVLYRLINYKTAQIFEKNSPEFFRQRVKYFDLTCETESAIKEIRALSCENKFELLFVIFPALARGERGECDWVIRKCREYGIKYIDLRGVFDKSGYENIRISNDDFCHPNKLGQELAAKEIYEYFIKNIPGVFREN